MEENPPPVLFVARLKPLLALLFWTLCALAFCPPVTPHIELTGVTTVNGVKKICVGQRIRATAISGVIPASEPSPSWGGAGWTFAWTISGGNYFANYNASADGASKTSYTAPNAPTTEWYFKTPTSSVTITCVVTPPAPANQFTLSTTVTV